jgi:hypothetical protein
MDVQREPIMLLAQVQLQYDPRYLNNFQPLFFLVVHVFTTSSKLGMERSWSNACIVVSHKNINPTTLPPQKAGNLKHSSLHEKHSRKGIHKMELKGDGP